ncbi:hypothetical protein [Streptomyces caniscabiei]|uniref:hypothetical protein n=1 Tax=Streptomyces caniscabiei TaxID=2746961 RepID=UPI0038D4B7AE
MRVTLCAGAVVAAALAASAPSVHAADSGDVSGNASGVASGGVSTMPVSPVPGADIQVRASECGGRTGTAASVAFVADAQLTQLTGRNPGTLAGETRVRSSLDPGTYPVRVTCDGRAHQLPATIKIGDGKPPKGTSPPTDIGPPADIGPLAGIGPLTGISPPTGTDISPPPVEPSAEPSSPPDRPAHRRPSSPSSPVAPVRAGGGGAAAQLAAAGDPADARGSADPANSMDDARHTGPGARHAVVGLVLAGVAAVAVVARGARRGRGRRTE